MRHSGIAHTFNALQQRYWVEKVSSAMRTVVNKCVICLRRGLTVQVQMMADLPASCLEIGAPLPFFYTGVDYFGPIDVKQDRSVVDPLRNNVTHMLHDCNCYVIMT